MTVLISFEALGAALSEELAINECIDKIKLSLSQENYLSNGDTVTAEITYDNEAAKAHKVKFIGSTVTLKVEGLEDAVKVDPFEGFEVTKITVDLSFLICYSQIKAKDFQGVIL